MNNLLDDCQQRRIQARLDRMEQPKEVLFCGVPVTEENFTFNDVVKMLGESMYREKRERDLHRGTIKMMKSFVGAK